MRIVCPKFKHNEMIPSKYTCDSEDINPSLEIEDIPKNAKSVALIMDDPDAPRGTWVHWVVWNIPIHTKNIEEGIEPEGTQGTTDFGRKGYGGPCPPSGTHRYFFKVYALDKELELKEGSTKMDLERSMKAHIIEKAELIGLYKRL